MTNRLVEINEDIGPQSSPDFIKETQDIYSKICAEWGKEIPQQKSELKSDNHRLTIEQSISIGSKKILILF